MKLTNCIEVLEQHGILAKEGVNIRCPLGTHDDKNPSFDLSNGLFHCHSCGVGGDYIKLYSLLNNIDNGEAFKLLEPERVKQSSGIVKFEKPIISHEKNEDLQNRFIELSKNEWSKEALEYLMMRGIEFDIVKNFIAHMSDMIYCPLKNQNGEVVGIQSRSIYEKKFKIEKGSKSGIFWKNNSPSKKKLYVVEGLFDWLSVRQKTDDVIGFVSATAFVDTAKIVNQYEEIYFLGDADEAGETLRIKFFEQFKNKKIHYRPKTSEKKDVNDLLAYEIGDNVALQELEKLCTLNNQELPAVSKSPDIYTWGVKMLDNTFHTPKKQKVTLLVADENAGKSSFCNFVGRVNAEKGHNVYYLSLESTEEEVHTAIAYSYAGITPEQYNNNEHLNNQAFLRKKEELKKDQRIKIIGRRIDKMMNIEEIEQLVKGLETVDLLFIDNLSAISRLGKNDNFEIEEIIKRILNISIALNCAIVLVHHYKKRQNNSKTRWRDVHEIAGSGAISKFSQQIIQVARNREPEDDMEASEFYIKEGKNRLEGKGEERTVYFHKGDFNDFYTKVL